jgi:ribosomal protein L30E
MIKTCFYALLVIAIINTSCNNNKQKQPNENEAVSLKEGSFGYDLNFLKQHDSVIVLKSDGENSQVIVSPKYQAKVFTSTADGNAGLSFGWVNYKAFTAPVDSHMNAYGGENRLWLGPEGGRFSLFFKPGAKMVIDNWKTPSPFDTETWNVTGKSDKSVSLQKEMKLVNYKGTEMQLSVDRKVEILSRQEINKNIGLILDTGVKAVGYETVNVITNKGANEWTEATGMPCIWILDMFKPAPSAVIVVPFKNAAGQPFDKVATTNYFGEIPGERLKHNDTILYFKADGKSRGKLGIVPNKAKPVAGSYDAEKHVLTLTMFEAKPEAKYLNQEWNTAKPPFSGDAVNAYNDGPLANGSQMGPFYEIESVSPAAFLKPAQSLTHKHSVYHFTGSQEALDSIAKKLFGVSLDEIKKAF